MKKAIIFIALVFLSFPFVQAQPSKPTKEETIKFMLTTLKAALGTDLSGDGYPLYDVEFNGDKYSRYDKKQSDWSGFTNIAKNIPWQEFESFDSDLKVGDNIVSVRPKFKIKVEQEIILWQSSGSKYNSREFYGNTFSMLVPAAKLESFKKAVHRLAEIAKEENKDPFEN